MEIFSACLRPNKAGAILVDQKVASSKSLKLLKSMIIFRVFVMLSYLRIPGLCALLATFVWLLKILPSSCDCGIGMSQKYSLIRIMNLDCAYLFHLIYLNRL